MNRAALAVLMVLSASSYAAAQNPCEATGTVTDPTVIYTTLTKYDDPSFTGVTRNVYEGASETPVETFTATKAQLTAVAGFPTCYRQTWSPTLPAYQHDGTTQYFVSSRADSSVSGGTSPIGPRSNPFVLSVVPFPAPETKVGS
jgi:hypothetical protein